MRATTAALALALAGGACIDPPRQDLRDQGYAVGGPQIAQEAGDSPPSFRITPGAPTQSLRIEVHGLDAGWLHVHKEPGFVESLLGLSPSALHVQPFDQPSFEVQAPASLRATVRIGVSDDRPGPPGDPARPRRMAESDPVKLRGRGARVVLQARTEGPKDAAQKPAGAPASSPTPGFTPPDPGPPAPE